MTTIRPPSLATYPSYLAAQVSKGAQRMLLDRLVSHGLRLHHFAVLAAMDDFGPQCQQDLCNSLDVDKSHMVTLVDDLNEAGLLTRQRDPKDRRRYRLGITAAGHDLLADLHQAEQACQEELFGHLDARERRAFQTTLAGIVARLDNSRLERSGKPSGVDDAGSELAVEVSA